MEKDEMIGKKFGRWTIIKFHHKTSSYGKCYECQCECGTTRVVELKSLKSGRSKSCGCWNSDRMKNQTGELHPNFKNIQGERFGRLIALEDSGKRHPGYGVIWKCQCDCGEIAYVPITSLTRGRTKSCGCYQRSGEALKGKAVIDLTGKRFGRLEVISKTDLSATDGCVKWLCKCDCGKETIVSSHLLIAGKTQSCGCMREERRTAALRTDKHREKKAEIGKKIWPEAEKWIGMQDDTNISIAKSKKVRKDSTTGYRGVFKKRDGQYFASLTFQKTKHTEYGFKTAEEAAKARERMYEEFVLPYLELVGRA